MKHWAPATFRERLERLLSKDEIADLAHYGVSGGYHGIIPCDELVEIYEIYHSDIWDTLNRAAQNKGRSTLEFIDEWSKGSVFNHVKFVNFLVLLTSEIIAQKMVSEKNLDHQG